jgi:hypothetical protein
VSEPDGPFAKGCLWAVLLAFGMWAGIIALVTWALQ